jgi:polar amino acid transport system substrate-binding protein
MSWAGWALALAFASASGAAAAAGEPPAPLVLVVDSATEMPMARIDNDHVSDGLTLEVAQLLAARLGRPLRTIAVARKRLTGSLVAGDADLACSYMPAWLPGPLQWSQGFIPQVQWLLTRADHPAPARVEDLRGQPIGTVLGFVYPELNQALGTQFVREDAPNVAANLRKLAAGRMQHATVASRVVRYAQQQGQFKAAVHPPLVLSTTMTQCALGPRAKVSLRALNGAIAQIERDGSLKALLARYD